MDGPNEVLDVLEDGPGKGALMDSDIIVIDDDWCLPYIVTILLICINSYAVNGVPRYSGLYCMKWNCLNNSKPKEVEWKWLLCKESLSFSHGLPLSSLFFSSTDVRRWTLWEFL